jgi:hypothetical protein
MILYTCMWFDAVQDRVGVMFTLGVISTTTKEGECYRNWPSSLNQSKTQQPKYQHI